ncbi:hypothetical protein COJ77_12760 [Bacillus cereus]|nr:hypothetical protein COJ77_12760 [Bacillus cereus]
MFVCIIINSFYFGIVDAQLTLSFKTLFIIVVVSILAILFFITDFIVLNMIINKVLILDFPYFFKGKVQIIAFLISLLIAIQEEFLFRYYLFQESSYPSIFLLLIGSVSFGVIHIVFSKYDIFSKTFLGFVCGVIFLLTNSILFSILFHIIYNYFTLKNKTTELEVSSFGN